MSKYLKLPSLQGSNNFTNGALLDFDIADDAYYNLANSYISLILGATTTETNPATGDNAVHAIYPSQAQRFSLKNNCFIGDYNLFASKVGMIDEVQTSNVMNANFDALSRDFEQITADNYKQLAQFYDPKRKSSNYYYPFSNLRIYSNSTTSPFELKIPLSSFSSFCNTQMYPAVSAGKTRVHVQLKTDNITPNEFNLYTQSYQDYQCADLAAPAAPTVITTVTYGAGHVVVANLDDILVRYTQGNINLIAISRVSVAPAVANGITTITLTGQALVNLATTFIVANSLATAQTSANVAVVMNNIPVAAALTAVNHFISAGNLDYSTAIGYIGYRVIVIGTNMLNSAGGAINYQMTTLVDVTSSNPVGQPDPANAQRVLRYRLADSVYVGAAQPISAITMYILKYDISPVLFNDTAVAGGAVNVTLLTVPNTTVSALNIWVGQKVTVTGYRLNTPATIDGVALISAITQNGVNVDVTFDRTIITLNNGDTGVKLGLYTIPSASQAWQISNPNLVVQQLSPMHKLVKNIPKQMNMVYPKFSIEKINIPTGTISFNKLFDVDPNVKNIFAMITDPVVPLISMRNNPGNAVTLDYYRWRVNDIDKTTRDILINSSLERDNIIQTFGNSSIPLANLQMLYGDDGAGNNIVVCVPMCVVPFGQPNRVLLTIGYSALTPNDRVLYLVKEGLAQLSF